MILERRSNDGPAPALGRVEARGLRLGAAEAETFDDLVALTRLLLTRLGGEGAERAADAAELAHRLLDRSLAGNPPAREPDCRKGCGHCCRVYVSATAPEVFALARAIRARPEALGAATMARVAAAEGAARGFDWSRDPFFTHVCPLLEDEACSLHPSRPDACRGVSSYSVRACIASLAALAERRDLAIPKVEEHALLRALHAHALWAALRAAGLSETQYSLNAALRLALERPDAEARWLAGEDVFAEVPRDSTAADTPRTLVEALAAAAAAPAPATASP